MLNSANCFLQPTKLIFDENILSMNKIRITVAPKTPTIPDCVKLSGGQNYNDTIIKGFEYTGETQNTISITNFCNTTFNISTFTLFSDIVGGGNFIATINAFTILPNQTLNVNVIYNGVYLGSNLTPNYSISLNGNSATYSLVVTVPATNNPPIVTDINLLLANRATKVFTLTDFTDHFTDLDGDTLDSVFITGDVTGYRLLGSPYVSGTEVPKIQITNGDLTYVAPDTNSTIDRVSIWKARDSAGTISV